MAGELALHKGSLENSGRQLSAPIPDRATGCALKMTGCADGPRHAASDRPDGLTGGRRRDQTVKASSPRLVPGYSTATDSKGRYRRQHPELLPAGAPGLYSVIPVGHDQGFE